MAKFFEGNTGLLYAGMIGLVASDIIPTPGDALYFHYVKKWRDQWTNGKLTSKQYWLREAAGYYLFNSVYWLSIGLIVYSIPGDFRKKAKVGLALAGTGIVAAVFFKNIQKDEQDGLAQENAKKTQLLNDQEQNT